MARRDDDLISLKEVAELKAMIDRCVELGIDIPDDGYLSEEDAMKFTGLSADELRQTFGAQSGDA